jgi:thiol peroxidase
MMATVIFKGKEWHTNGELPLVGATAPGFLLTKTDLTDIAPQDMTGKKVILNIFPSIETPVCAASVKRFNAEIAKMDNTDILCVSKDLPFAHSRFNREQEIKDVISVCELRDQTFGDNYGMRITDGPLAGLFARAVIVMDENHKIIFRQLVPDISIEPDYDVILQVIGVSETVESCSKTMTAEHSRLTDDDDFCDDGRSGPI